MKDQGPEHAHSSPIKTPRQLLTVIALAFAIPVLGIILLAKLVVSGYTSAVSDGDASEIAARIQPVARIEFSGAGPVAGGGAPKSGEEVYKAVCAACHATGAAGAHKFADQAAWAPHLKEGADALVKNAINGIRAMPPRGGNPNLSDLEVARAVVYMTNAAGANFKEPAAPAKPAAPAAAAAAPAPTPAPAPATAASAATTAPAAAAAAAPAAGGTAAAGGDKGKAVYGQACFACHATGAAGAPKFGDKGQWEARLKQGMETLYASSIKGKGAMPPKGGQVQLPDADIKAAVDYMVSAVK